jgi:hypothetical protein
MADTLICPTCRQPMPEQEQPHYLAAVPGLTQIEKRIVKFLADAYPESLGIDDLVFEVYGEESDGRPDGADRYIIRRVARIRNILEPHRWTIPHQTGGRGNKGIYKLEKIR